MKTDTEAFDHATHGSGVRNCHSRFPAQRSPAGCYFRRGGRHRDGSHSNKRRTPSQRPVRSSDARSEGQPFSMPCVSISRSTDPRRAAITANAAHARCCWTVVRINSCLTLAAMHDGQAITTIEGLADAKRSIRCKRLLSSTMVFNAAIARRADLFRHGDARESRAGAPS